MSGDPTLTSPRGDGAPDRHPEGRLFADNDLVAGRYQIVRFVARGGMGEVYEAEDLELVVRVALKTIRADFVSDETVERRFKREIQLARKITHPGVCRIFDVGHHERGGSTILFLTMELLPGKTLASRLAARGRFTVAEAAPLVASMVAALRAAHEAGVVHSDFKSGNVLLAGDRVVVTDFGLARGAVVEMSAASTAPAGIVGTPAYMAPEQVEGTEISPATDVYALGVVMYEMVTGEQPFQAGAPLHVAVKRLREPAPSPRSAQRELRSRNCADTRRVPKRYALHPPRRHVPELDPRWEAVILACLERDPARRPRTDQIDGLLAVGPPRWRGRIGAAALLVAAALGGTALVLLPGEPPTVELPVTSRRAVAVLAFKNLSSDASVAWIATALAETLTTEMAAAPTLRAISGEVVARARHDLALAAHDEPGPETLARIRAAVGADVVVSGSYLSSGGRLRLDVRVQDTRLGEILVSLSEAGTDAELLELVGRVGVRLRADLGASATSPARAQPRNIEAARRYAEGLLRWRAFDWQAAREQYLAAIAADPDFAPAHAALADVWQGLGYAAKASEEAKKAFELAGSRSREERLLIEASYRSAVADTGRAIEIYRTLRESFPDNLDYGLKLASEQVYAGQLADAQATLALLRALPAPDRDDPRIDIVAAEAFRNAGDQPRRRAVAVEAARKGRARGSRHTIATARESEGWAAYYMGDPDAAVEAFAESGRLAGEIGDRRLVALARYGEGVMRFMDGDVVEGERMYEDSLRANREIGDARGTAEVLSDLAFVVMERGDYDLAQRYVDESMALAREIGDTHRLGMVYYHLGNVAFYRGDLAPARAHEAAARLIFERRGNLHLAAFAMYALGEIALAEGRLDEARETMEQVVAQLQAHGHKPYQAYAKHGLGWLYEVTGDLTRARALHEEGLAIRVEAGQKRAFTDSWIALARLSIEEGDLSAAIGWARQASELAARQRSRDREIMARTLLSRALRAKGDLAAAADEMAQVAPLVTASQSPYVRLCAGIEAAALQGDQAPARSDTSVTKLLALAAEAERAGFVLPLLEARLAAARLELAGGRPAAGRRRLAAVEIEARARGYGLFVKMAGRP